MLKCNHSNLNSLDVNIIERGEMETQRRYSFLSFFCSNTYACCTNLPVYLQDVSLALILIGAYIIKQRVTLCYYRTSQSSG